MTSVHVASSVAKAVNVTVEYFEQQLGMVHGGDMMLGLMSKKFSPTMSPRTKRVRWQW